MGEDHPRVGVVARVADHVLTQRRYSAPTHGSRIGSVRSCASANSRGTSGWSSVNCSARGCSFIPLAPPVQRAIRLDQRPVPRIGGRTGRAVLLWSATWITKSLAERVAVRLKPSGRRSNHGRARRAGPGAGAQESNNIPGRSRPRCVCASNSPILGPDRGSPAATGSMTVPRSTSGFNAMNAMGTTHNPTRSLTEPWDLGGVMIPNRVVLPPLAGIGNWFVRLQAKPHGAGLAVSEMVSSHAVHCGNERTCREAAAHPPGRASGVGAAVRRRPGCDGLGGLNASPPPAST